MSGLTRLALQRPTVVLLVIVMVLAGGVATYRGLQVELFPQIEFPLVTVATSYPPANPEAVVRDVTGPIENAILGMEGLQDVRSTSFEGRSLVLANFEFGTDMAEAERAIKDHLSALRFPRGAGDPSVRRINPDALPVLQLSVLGERSVPELQRIVEDRVLPAITRVDGVLGTDVTGATEQQVLVTVDADALAGHGLSLSTISRALRGNSVQEPGGAVGDRGRVLPVRVVHTYGSLDDLRSLAIAPSRRAGRGQAQDNDGLVRLSDVARVELGTGSITSISRTNGKPSLGINIRKKPEANTVDVTRGVLDRLDQLEGLPQDVEIVTISNSGSDIQGQIDALQREAVVGFAFAVAVVFLFLLALRSGIVKGLSLALRPTAVIGLSIPLSILLAILAMYAAGMTLNFMTLGGLAIAVGRVVDDSIVVLENAYRHIERGENRWAASLAATREVAGAITASTLTTIAVFAPLAFIQGIVGAFFLPFAVAVTLALLASLLVALTAIPVLGAVVLRPGDPFRSRGGEAAPAEHEGWMQRAYTPVLLWALRHKGVALGAATALTLGSLALIAIIPVTLFPSGGQRMLNVELAIPPGTPLQGSLRAVGGVERLLGDLRDEGVVDSYRTTVGRPQDIFGPGGGAFDRAAGASIFVLLTEDAPGDLAETLRRDLGSSTGARVTVEEINPQAPTSSELELTVTGREYDAVSGVARELAAEVGSLEGVVNVRSDVTEARREVVVAVRPEEAARLGLTTGEVASQVSRFLRPQRVLQMELDGKRRDLLLRVQREDVDSLEEVKALRVGGAGEAVPLGRVAEIRTVEGPVTVSRTDGERSASVSGTITAENVQEINGLVQQRIEALDIPPGVQVSTGGIFRQIGQGFRDIFLAIGIGVVLVYLVMVASLGALRNPFVIILSLPLALVGALAALAVTGRALGMPAMMGMLLLAGIVVTNAIVLITFVEQLRHDGHGVHDALVRGGRIRLRPILMTALTTSLALVPLATFVSEQGGLIGAELATVVIGGLISSTALTLIVVPVVYVLMHQSLPALFGKLTPRGSGTGSPGHGPGEG